MQTFVRRFAAWTAVRWCFRSHFPLKPLAASVHTSCTCSSRTLPELTSVRYPNINRGEFGSLSTADVDFFKKLLINPGQVLTNDDDLLSYNVDWMGSYRGNVHIHL